MTRLWSIVTVILLAVLNNVNGLDKAPELECMDEGMRLHFIPNPSQPFSGHVYIKGYYFSKNCHLDYTHQTITDPFFFHVPFKSECQIKRDRGQQGTTYSIIVIVQHHPLFITEMDRAYDVSCFYREGENRLENTLEINDMTTAGLSDEQHMPDCGYNVVRGGVDGEPVKFANIGDVLVHKWSCKSETQGILVHSCFVRDGVGNEFPLLDDRGCPTNGSLMRPLTYNEELTTAYTQLSAFKFADQMVVYFSCQITLCRKNQNGCEGITPPTCPLASVPTTPLFVTTIRPTISPQEENTTISVTTEASSSTTEAETNVEQPEAQQRDTPNLFHSHSRPFPASRHARDANKTMLTMDVAADSLIVFTKDENPAGTLAFKMDNICSAAYSQIGLGWTAFLITIVVMCSALLYIQRRYYTSKITDLARLLSPIEMGYTKADNRSLGSQRSLRYSFQQ